MKKILLFAVALTALLSVGTQKAQAAGIPILYSTGPATQSLHTFETPIEIDGDTYTDFGIVFEQFSIFSVPLWNYGLTPAYAFYSVQGRTINYVEVTKESYEIARSAYSLEFEDEVSLSFWNTIGGKLVAAAAIILVVVFFAMRGSKDEKEEAAQ